MDPSFLDTDLYELNMAASYLRRGMTGSATFSLYVRALPPGRGFLVAAGLEECLDALERQRMGAGDASYLSEIGFDEESVGLLSGLRFTGDVWAIPEGRIVVEREPILEVTAPIAEAQVVETILLNLVGLHTTLASKAARYVVASGGRITLVDYSLRRAHGLDAGLAAARSSAIVGFDATSNVAAARAMGLPVSGTMAHSYVEAFEDEVDAFRAFARDHQGALTFLVDTYDTLQGVRTAVQVIEELDLRGDLGIRIDSGDLDSMSRGARDVLDAAGHPEVRVVVSGGLDDVDIAALVSAGAPVDAAGIGAKMGVSADAPSLDTAYKLVEHAGRPVLKLSVGKSTLPGAKQVWRARNPLRDTLCLRSEPVPGGAEPLLEHVMAGGRRTGPRPSIAEARERFREDLGDLPAAALDLAAPAPGHPQLSPGLEELAGRLTRALTGASRPGSQPL